MSLNFTPAVRHEAKARVAIIGPTGAGKTWTALEWATVLGEKIAVIDTENGSASLYSDLYTFDTATWGPPYTCSKLAAAIADAGKTYDVLVIDSLTHFWQGEGGVLDVVDRAAAKARGNTYAGWKEGTPVWRSLLDALIYAPCHVIVTMRSKMEYLQQQGSDGRTKIEKVGMAPVARNDVEYEFLLVGDMDQGHKMTVTKSRCAPLADEVALPHQSARLAVILRDWLSSAKPAPEPQEPNSAPVRTAAAGRVLTNPSVDDVLAAAGGGDATVYAREDAAQADLATEKQIQRIVIGLKDYEAPEAIVQQIRDEQPGITATELRRAVRLRWLSEFVGRPVGSTKELTKVEAGRVLDHLEQQVPR